jgi:hypothetical protein
MSARDAWKLLKRPTYHKLKLNQIGLSLITIKSQYKNALLEINNLGEYIKQAEKILEEAEAGK